jgi:hypothetical protein
LLASDAPVQYVFVPAAAPDNVFRVLLQLLENPSSNTSTLQQLQLLQDAEARTSLQQLGIRDFLASDGLNRQSDALGRKSFVCMHVALAGDENQLPSVGSIHTQLQSGNTLQAVETANMHQGVTVVRSRDLGSGMLRSPSLFVFTCKVTQVQGTQLWAPAKEEQVQLRLNELRLATRGATIVCMLLARGIQDLPCGFPLLQQVKTQLQQ